MKKVFCIVSNFFFLTLPIWAKTNTGMPWEDPLQKIADSLSGPVPKIIGLVMGVGAGIMLAVTEGKSMPQLLWVVIGLGIALNAASFIAGLFGSASGFIF